MMTTYGIKEFKAKASEIIRDLKEGEEVIITRRGKPCGKLISVSPSKTQEKPLSSLRGAMTKLPYATYQDFLDIKKIWEPRALNLDGYTEPGSE